MKKFVIWVLVVVAILWGIGAAGTVIFECQGALGSGVHCTKGGAGGSFMESYLPSMEVGLIFVIFLGVPLGIVVGSVLLFRKLSRREKEQNLSASSVSTPSGSWTKYLLLIPAIGIGLVFLMNILFD